MPSLPPLAVLESWPQANYTDPVIRGHALTIVNSLFIAITIIVVGLRVYVRGFVVRVFGADDYLICAAMVPTIAMSACITAAEVRYGWNRHAWDLPFPYISAGYKIALAVECCFVLSSQLTKLSLLFLYRRIFRRNHPAWFIPVLWTLVMFMCLQGLVYPFVLLFQCRPMRAYWTYLPSGTFHCIDERTDLVILSSINTICDFLVVLVPIPLTLALKMDRKQFYATASLFLMAGGVCFVGVARVVLDSLVIDRTYDLTWQAYPLWIVSGMEIYVGVILVSLPSLRPLISRWMPSISISFPGSSPVSKSNRTDRTDRSSYNDFGKYVPRNLFQSHELDQKRGKQSLEMSTEPLFETRSSSASPVSIYPLRSVQVEKPLPARPKDQDGRAMNSPLYTRECRYEEPKRVKLSRKQDEVMGL